MFTGVGRIRLVGRFVCRSLMAQSFSFSLRDRYLSSGIVKRSCKVLPRVKQDRVIWRCRKQNY